MYNNIPAMSIKPTVSYSFVNERGNTLTMTIGVVKDMPEPQCFRVRMIGINIPFPVRSNTWFTSGLGVNGLIQYLGEQGYNLVSKTYLFSGESVVYHLSPCFVHDFDPVAPNDKAVENAAKMLKLVGRSDVATELLAGVYGLSDYAAINMLNSLTEQFIDLTSR